MAKADRKAKNSAMASDLLRRGIYHGKRQSVGLSNIPSLTASGSAAYRRAKAAKTVGAKPSPAPYAPSLNSSLESALSHPVDHVGRLKAAVHITERELMRR